MDVQGWFVPQPVLAVSGAITIKTLLAIADKGAVGGRCVDYFARVNESEVISVSDCSALISFDRTADVVFLGVEFGGVERPFQDFETLLDCYGGGILLPANLSVANSQQ
jgi:hypothetical protein